MITIEQMSELDKARTQGEWKDISNNRDIDAMVIWSTGREDGLKHHATYLECTDADSDFIAACSTFVPWAIARIKQLENQRDAILSVMARDQEFWEKDKKYIEKLEEALRWYADLSNYRYESANDKSDVEWDQGERARLALRE